MPSADKLTVRDRGDFYSLPEEAIEEHAAGWGPATIEPERKFIQIIAQSAILPHHYILYLRERNG